MVIWYILIISLLVIILLLAFALFFFAKKGHFFSKKERDFIIFVMDMYIQYAEDLEIHSKSQHKKIVEELSKIKKKISKNE